MKTSRKFISAAILLSAMLLPLPAVADEAREPGIVTSTGISATISAKGMPAGSEMWALWLSLPAGKRVEVKDVGFPSTWLDTELSLNGSSVSEGTMPPGKCFLFRAGMLQDFSGSKITTRPGDGFACGFAASYPFWEENKGTELYARAQFSIGGPFRQGQVDMPEEYRKAGGEAQAMNVDIGMFNSVEQELRAAGAMTTTIRQVTMPPGSKSMVTDRYPTLRMITSGKLSWGGIPEGSDMSLMPKSMSEKSRFDWIGWRNSGPLVLLNKSDKPVEFVEWSVAPAPGSAP